MRPVHVRDAFHSRYGSSQSVAAYAVDDHHTLSALDFSGFDEVLLNVSVLCDWRGKAYDAFWWGSCSRVPGHSDLVMFQKPIVVHADKRSDRTTADSTSTATTTATTKACTNSRMLRAHARDRNDHHS